MTARKFTRENIFGRRSHFFFFFSPPSSSFLPLFLLLLLAASTPLMVNAFISVFFSAVFFCRAAVSCELRAVSCLCPNFLVSLRWQSLQHCPGLLLVWTKEREKRKIGTLESPLRERIEKSRWPSPRTTRRTISRIKRTETVRD